MYKKEGEEEGQDTALFDIIEQIGKNLEQKYEETLKKLIDKQNESKNPQVKKGPKDEKKEFNNRDRERDRGDREDRGDRGDRDRGNRDRDRDRDG